MDPSITFTISTNSVATFYSNSVAGTPWLFTIATNNGGVALEQCNNLAGTPMRLISQYITTGLNGLSVASARERCKKRLIHILKGLLRQHVIHRMADEHSDAQPVERARSNTLAVTATKTIALSLSECPSLTRSLRVSTSHSLSHSKVLSATYSATGDPTLTSTLRESRRHTLRLTHTALLTPTMTPSGPSRTASPSKTDVAGADADGEPGLAVVAGDTDADARGVANGHCDAERVGLGHAHCDCDGEQDGDEHADGVGHRVRVGERDRPA
jgi:hypothetical protein